MKIKLEDLPYNEVAELAEQSLEFITRELAFDIIKTYIMTNNLLEEMEQFCSNELEG